MNKLAKPKTTEAISPSVSVLNYLLFIHTSNYDEKLEPLKVLRFCLIESLLSFLHLIVKVDNYSIFARFQG